MKLQIAQQRRRRLISLTPLIDVVFILLFFFMLASSLQNWRGIGFHLGGTSAAAPQEQNPQRFVVHPGASVEHNGERLALTAFATYMESQPHDRLVIMVPAPATPLQDLVSVVDAAQLAGVQRIVFGARQ